MKILTFLIIEFYRNELADEKSKHRDTKRTSDEKVRQFQQEVRDGKQVTDEKKKMCSELESKVTDLDDKWSKSKRINKQKQDKIDSLEKELESSKASGKYDSFLRNTDISDLKIMHCFLDLSKIFTFRKFSF